MSLLPSRRPAPATLGTRWPLLFDDAAIFPPGNLPLPEAVRAHQQHRSSWYADLVGPLVLSPSALTQIGRLVTSPIDVAVTVPSPDAAATVLADEFPGIRIVALEVAVPDDFRVGAVVPAVDAALSELGGTRRALGGDPTVYVEVPRDARRDALIEELAGTSYRAKLRTGGVSADLYPGDAELARAVHALVLADVPFKATAGLHHALRNTDPETGFEQHGFVNLLAATAAATDGADTDELAVLLAARQVRHLPEPPTTCLLGSIGTCSIAEPIDELMALGLLSAEQVTP